MTARKLAGAACLAAAAALFGLGAGRLAEAAALEEAAARARLGLADDGVRSPLEWRTGFDLEAATGDGSDGSNGRAPWAR